MKNIIGIISLWDSKKDSMWLVPTYSTGIEKVNGLPIVLPLTDNVENILQMCDICDGFLFTGGHDVNPNMYHQEPIAQCGEVCNVRDTMEKIIFQYALKEDKSILGICRGIQLINVLCGGTLYQDLSLQHKSSINHVQKPPYSNPQHSVYVQKDTPLYNTLNKSKIDVNSYHHQAIDVLGEDLKVSAISQDGLIEAVYMPNKKFIQGIQWHPEFSIDNPDSIKILDSFVKSCN
ncbi:MAG: gamma-glutamyl-gamma-aminobutyrate hydrolase family protein [Ruminococcus sp.]|nr:gamma-glutamyl-gamma-aminobutyrate hydrolase family protein [Ruminococcus sp.]